MYECGFGYSYMFGCIIREIVRLRVRDRSRDVAKGFPGYNKQTVVCLCTLVWHKKQTVVCLRTPGWDRETNGRMFAYSGMA